MEIKLNKGLSNNKDPKFGATTIDKSDGKIFEIGCSNRSNMTTYQKYCSSRSPRKHVPRVHYESSHFLARQVLQTIGRHATQGSTGPVGGIRQEKVVTSLGSHKRSQIS